MKKLVCWLMVLSMMMSGFALAEDNASNDQSGLIDAQNVQENGMADGAQDDEAAGEDETVWIDFEPMLLSMAELSSDEIMETSEFRALFTAMLWVDMLLLEDFDYDMDIVSSTYVGEMNSMIIFYGQVDEKVSEQEDVPVMTQVPDSNDKTVQEKMIFIIYAPALNSIYYTIGDHFDDFGAEFYMNSFCEDNWYKNDPIDLMNAIDDVMELFI